MDDDKDNVVDLSDARGRLPEIRRARHVGIVFCSHSGMVDVDVDARRVICNKCGVDLDPISVLEKIACKVEQVLELRDEEKRLIDRIVELRQEERRIKDRVRRARKKLEET